MRRSWLSLTLLCSSGWLGAQSQPAPELGLDVNAQSDAIVSRGWPLLIRVAVISADGQPVRVGLGSGSWTHALHLSISDQNGVAQNWPVQLVPPASSALSLNGIATGEAVWLVAPTDTAAITPGLYSLSVTLDTTTGAAAGSWTGSVQSSGATVQLQDEPGTLAAEDEASKYLALAAYPRLRGDAAGVGTALDTLIGRQPDSLQAYFEKGDLLAAGGDFAGALALEQQALDKFFARYPNPPEPPALLMRSVQRLADRLVNQQVAQGGRVVTSVEPGSTETVVAPDSIVSGYGAQLATTSTGASGSLETTLGGTTVTITDSSGTASLAPLFYVSPGQVNYQVPPSAALGAATVTVKASDGSVSTGLVSIAAFQPGLFTFNTDGLIAGNILRVSASGQQTPEDLFTLDSTGAILARPIDLSGGGQVFLILYGTGIRGTPSGQVSVSIGGVPATVAYAGPQGSFVSLDQINAIVPPGLAGRGDVPIILTAAGKRSNTAHVTFK